MKGKKLISIFTCSFLLLGGGTLLAVQSTSKGEVRQVRADDPVDLGQIIFTGILSSSTNSAISFYTVQTNDISNGWSAMNFVAGTVTLNSDDISSGAKFQKANVHDYYFPIGQEADIDDVLTIDASFQGEDEGVTYSFTVQRLQAKWNGSTWNFVNQDVGSVGFENVHGASNASALYLRGKDTYDTFPQAWDPAEYCAYYPVSGEGYLTLNGNTLTGAKLRKVPEIQSGYYWYLELGTTADVGDVFRIGGTWAGCGFSFTIEEFAKEWSGSEWSYVNQDAGTVTLVGVDANPAASSATGISFISEGTNDVPTSWDTKYLPQTGASVTLNGNDVTANTFFKKPGAQGYFLEGFGTAAVNSIVTVSGEFAGQSGDTIYHFTVNEFSRQWNGTVWTPINVYADDVTLNGLSSDGPSDDHRFTLYSTNQNEVPTSWDRAFTIESGDVRKNGVPIDGVVCKKVGQQGYFFEGFTVAENDVIKIDATFVGTAGEYVYHFHISEYSIQYHGAESGWGLVDLNLGNIEFTRALPDSSASAVYLYTEATNDIPYSPDWLHIYPDGDEQVLFNESDITEGHTIQKAGDNSYYMGLGREAIFGDLLTIKGAWSIDIGQYKYHFTVPEISLRYSGEAWQTLAEYKESCKDVLDNYLIEDNYLPADWSNALDIIRNGKDNIDVCVDFNDVDSMLDNFKGHLDDVPTKTERAQEAAAEVDALIDDIIDINRRNYDEEKAKTVAARTAYDALSEEAKGYVTKLSSLQGAEGRIRDIEAAIAVDELIDAIGEVTLAKEQQITAARAAYDALNANQNRFVLHLDVLQAAEARLAELKANKAAAEEVEELIEAIGEVNVLKECREKIEAARTAYDALNEEAKAMVTNYGTLTAAEARFAELLAAAKEDGKTMVDNIYASINLKKYSKDNQAVIAQLVEEAKAAIDEAEDNESIEAIIQAFEADLADIPVKKAANKGCGGSIVATSVVLSALALAGLGLLSIKKRKED